MVKLENNTNDININIIKKKTVFLKKEKKYYNILNYLDSKTLNNIPNMIDKDLNILKYYEFYKHHLSIVPIANPFVNSKSIKITKKDLDNIEKISFYDYKEKLLLSKLSNKNKLESFFTDNIDIIKSINENISLKKIIENKKRLSKISEHSSQEKKGGNNLTSNGQELLSILHLFDRKHDFYKEQSLRNFINNDTYKQLNQILHLNQPSNIKYTNDFNNNKDFEDKILLDALENIINNTFITNTNGFNTLAFIDLKDVKNKLEYYYLNILQPEIDTTSRINIDFIYDKIADIIKDFWKLNDINNTFYLLDIDVNAINQNSELNHFNRNIYSKIANKRLHPLEDVFDPHPSNNIVINNPSDADLYREITNINFNSAVDNSAIRNNTRKYINITYYKDATDNYYQTIIFNDDNINTMQFYTTFANINMGGTNNFLVKIITPEGKHGIYFKDSFNEIGILSDQIEKLIYYYDNNNKVGFETDYNKDANINISNKSIEDIIVEILVKYLYYNYKDNSGNFQTVIEGIINILFDLKKAGDWGQSLFCAKYNELKPTQECFFVSGDRLSALRSILTAKTKTVFMSKYKAINKSHAHNILSLFKNNNKFNFKNFIEYFKNNIYSSKYTGLLYSRYIINRNFYNDYNSANNGDNVDITDSNFNYEYFTAFLNILKYDFILYFNKNALVKLNKYNSIVIERNSITYSVEDENIGHVYINNRRESNEKRLNDKIDFYMTNNDNILNYIKDFDNQYNSIVIDKFDKVLNIINNIANVNKLYSILFCNNDLSKNISTIKDVIIDNKTNIITFLKGFNTVFNDDSHLKAHYGKYYLHKALYDTYQEIIFFDKIFINYYKLYNILPKNQHNNLIIKFRNIYNINTDITSSTILIDDIKLYLGNIIATFAPTLSDNEKKMYISLFNRANKPNPIINTDLYDMYIKNVLTDKNIKLLNDLGYTALINVYNEIKEDIYSNKLAFLFKGENIRISYSIANIKELLDSHYIKLRNYYSILFYNINKVYLNSTSNNIYFIQKPDLNADNKNDITILNTLFTVEDTNIKFSYESIMTSSVPEISSLMPAVVQRTKERNRGYLRSEASSHRQTSPPISPTESVTIARARARSRSRSRTPPATGEIEPVVELNPTRAQSRQRQRPTPTPAPTPAPTRSRRGRDDSGLVELPQSGRQRGLLVNVIQKPDILDSRTISTLFRSIRDIDSVESDEKWINRLTARFKLLESTLKIPDFFNLNKKEIFEIGEQVSAKGDKTKQITLDNLLKNICFIEYILQELFKMESPDNILSTLSIYFNTDGNTNYEIIKYIKTNKTNYFYEDRTEIFEILKRYIDYIRDYIKENITAVSGRTDIFGFKELFKSHSTSKLLNITNQLDILVKFITH